MMRRLHAYGFAVAATAAALLVTRLLWPKVEPASFELFLVAVVLTAWGAGLGPALVATFLSALVIDYYFVPPIYELNFHPGNAVRLVVFAGVSLLIVGLTQAERRARARADAASRAKDRMLAVVSHDLRGPLNAVVGWVHVLRRTVKDPTTERGLDVIERSAEAQRQLIEDLLDIVRIEAGTLRLEPRVVDLAEVVQASVDAIRPAAESKGVALEVSIEAGSHVVWADPARLQQVTGNLLTNALRFTPERGRVAVQVAGDDGQVSLRVRDSGPGIAPDVLPHLFAPLAQTPARPGARGDGLGLGLAIARRIVELHGGTIEATSPDEDRGAIFTISLPLGRRATPVSAR
ncbi:MAG TPA: ATP-binding protein [Methylomirabilota bacterium]|jgi:signal transduction histidine kinase|nr:ATP-binding protein [Methylomirabilota bacterium]